MNPWMTISGQKPGKFRVGDKVRIKHGWGGVICTVTEEFGDLGPGGQGLYDVTVPLDDPFPVTVTDDQLELVERPPANGKHR